MFTVKQSFFWNGRLYAEGQDVAPGDPVVTGRRHLFDGDDVESATAAPGEKRSTRRPAAKPKTSKSK